jgi:hypothetical protein
VSIVWTHRHLLGIGHLAQGDILHLLDHAERWFAMPRDEVKNARVLHGCSIVNLFFESSPGSFRSRSPDLPVQILRPLMHSGPSATRCACSLAPSAPPPYDLAADLAGRVDDARTEFGDTTASDVEAGVFLLVAPRMGPRLLSLRGLRSELPDLRRRARPQGHSGFPLR